MSISMPNHVGSDAGGWTSGGVSVRVEPVDGAGRPTVLAYLPDAFDLDAQGCRDLAQVLLEASAVISAVEGVSDRRSRAVVTMVSGAPVGAHVVGRDHALHVECSRCDHSEAFPPAHGRVKAVQRAVVEHDRGHAAATGQAAG